MQKRTIGTLLLALTALPLLGASALKPVELRCEYAREPLGIDSATPRLFWKLQSNTRAQAQSGYQVLVASSADLLARDKGDLWDSGKVASDETAQVNYAGKPLRSSQQVFWKVRSWDAAGHRSGWSSPASWTMGLLAPSDWHAQWIGAVASSSVAHLLGYHCATTPDPDQVKWVQVDLGKPAAIDLIRLVPMVHQNRKGFGFPVRFKIEAADQPEFTNSSVLADNTASDFPNPGEKPVTFQVGGKSARYVRLTTTRLWKRDELFCFALCELEVESGGKNIAEHAKVKALDSVENYGWGRAGLTDGYCGAKSEATDPQTVLLRREFVVKPRLKRALAHVCGLGTFEMTLNGRKAGDALFPPGWTKYDKTCLYETYDVTPLLRPGTNAAGLLLANGMYNVVGGRYTKFTGSFGPLRAIAQIRLDYADGSSDLVTTDPAWRWAPGPITFCCVYGGEDYDARLEPRGWTQAGFDDRSWQTPVVTQGPGGMLKGFSCSAPPIRTFETLKPVGVRNLNHTTAVYDLGQNVSLMPRLRVHGSPGAKVRIIPAELLGPDGHVDRGSCSHNRPAYWEYILAGTGRETWFPKFFYHGSRYLEVQLTAAPAGELPSVDAIEGVVVHSSSEPVGEFECSNPLFNRIRALVRWAQRSNMMSVMTDCPHREKLGWLEEDHLNGPSLRYEFALDQLFTKVLNDMADSQLENGLVPDIAPEYVQFSGGFRDSPEWGSAVLLVPWQQYQFSGDLDLLRNYYAPMQRYVDYLGSRAQDHIVSHGLGDWYDIGPKPPGVAQLTPVPLTATAFYYYDAFILGETAALLGRTADAEKYRALAREIRSAFNRTFYNPTNRCYATGSQCANAIALVMNLAEPGERAGVLDAIVRDVRSRGNALTAGDVGYRYLLCALADGGRSDLIFEINNQSVKPGYGYQLKQGATSLTEAWDAGRGSSQNHFMLGQIMEWFYHDLGGIAPDPEHPGFKNVIIKPTPAGDLTWARASYNSIRGPISTRWERKPSAFTLDVAIPPNTTATVYIPARTPDGITESGKALGRIKSVRVKGQERGCVVVNLSSGTYHFQAPAF